MSVPTRYLLDKVIVRYTLDAMLSLSTGRDLSDQLALASFSTNHARDILGMHSFVTYDHPLVNLWQQKQDQIARRFDAMRRQLNAPYDHAELPGVELMA